MPHVNNISVLKVHKIYTNGRVASSLLPLSSLPVPSLSSLSSLPLLISLLPFFLSFLLSSPSLSYLPLSSPSLLSLPLSSLSLSSPSLVPPLSSPLSSSSPSLCCQEFQQELYQLKDEFERYKMRAQSVLKSRGSKVVEYMSCKQPGLYDVTSNLKAQNILCSLIQHSD